LSSLFLDEFISRLFCRRRELQHLAISASIQRLTGDQSVTDGSRSVAIITSCINPWRLNHARLYTRGR